MKIKKKNLRLFYQLINIPLHGKELKACIKIGKNLHDNIMQTEYDRIAILEKYGKRDEEGKIVYRRDEFQRELVAFDGDAEEKYNKECEAMYDQEANIDIEKEYRKTIRDLLARLYDYDEKKGEDFVPSRSKGLNVDEGIIYDEIINCLEDKENE